jgi:SAM-dependent methyltransferase
VWCGSALDRGAIRLHGRTGCPHCGAATTCPWPTAEELAAAYGSWYRPGSGRRFSFLGDPILRRTRGMLAGRLDAIAPPGPVLDVGAGDGVLIDALKRRGRDALGLERDSRRPDVSDKPLAEVDRDGEWAAIVFWHALEHLPEPGDAIRQAARLLRSDGVLVVAVPNTASLQARAFGDRWLHLDLPRHLVHLTARTLTTGLEQRGFAIEHESHLRAGQIVIGWLDGLVGSLPGDLRLYQALRRPVARSGPVGRRGRVTALAAALALLPVAAACAAVESGLRRGGTVYVEARLA